MELNLNIEDLVPAPKRAQPIPATQLRVINEADIALLENAPALPSAGAPLKKLSDRHHMLARLLAAGSSEADAALVTGYCASRISVLKQSPAFTELVALYRAEVNREFASALNHMAGLSKDALMELRDRLEEDPTKFSNRELLALTTELADRSSDAGAGGMAPTRIELVAPIVEEGQD